MEPQTHVQTAHLFCLEEGDGGCRHWGHPLDGGGGACGDRTGTRHSTSLRTALRRWGRPRRPRRWPQHAPCPHAPTALPPFDPHVRMVRRGGAVAGDGRVPRHRRPCWAGTGAPERPQNGPEAGAGGDREGSGGRVPGPTRPPSSPLAALTSPTGGLHKPVPDPQPPGPLPVGQGRPPAHPPASTPSPARATGYAARPSISGSRARGGCVAGGRHGIGGPFPWGCPGPRLFFFGMMRVHRVGATCAGGHGGLRRRWRAPAGGPPTLTQPRAMFGWFCWRPGPQPLRRPPSYPACPE